jgi:hypothetical protein
MISHSWNGTDYVLNLVSEMEQANQILPTLTQEDIYIWCEKDEKRYKKQIPPGFKDAKD